MNKVLVSFVIVVIAFFALVTPSFACSPTDFYRDGVPMTAFFNGVSVGDTSIVASDCDIGVYFGPGSQGFINGADISGAKYYGVLIQGANVEVKNTFIHDIGVNLNERLRRRDGWPSIALLIFNVNSDMVKTSNNKFKNNHINFEVITYEACRKIYGGFYDSTGLCTSP